MASVTVREAREGDHLWAARVMAGSDPWMTLGRTFDACLRSCTSPIDQLYIAWDDGTRLGLALVRERGIAGAPYLVSIAVAEGARSSGVGAAMLAFVEALFRPRYRHLFLCVSSFNARARAFYERHGYQAAGVLPDFIIDGADEVLMVKRLQPPQDEPASAAPGGA